MVLLMNMVPLLLVLFWGVIVWKFGRMETGMSPLQQKDRRLRQVAITIGAILSFVIYMMLHPSYLPKGKVKREAVPAFEQKEIPVQDRVKRTNPDEHKENTKQMHKDFMEGK